MGVGGHGDEVVMLVEAGGLLVDGIDDHDLAAGRSRRVNDGGQRQDEQLSSETTALDPSGADRGERTSGERFDLSACVDAVLYARPS